MKWLEVLYKYNKFKELKEFYETFEISTQKQIKVKMNEEQQEEFLKRVKQENEKIDLDQVYYKKTSTHNTCVFQI